MSYNLDLKKKKKSSFLFCLWLVDLNFEEQEKLLSVPGTCMPITLSCPYDFSWTTHHEEYLGGSLVAKQGKKRG